MREKETLQRIASLAIPPAYRQVWISLDPDSHLQATGRDARGRKQYRYHPRWIQLSAGNKFERMLAFGQSLPTLRSRVRADLKRHDLGHDRVLAAVVWFLENSLIRVGNRVYAKENHTYGLTTMRAKYCTVDGSAIEFRFVGKRGIKHAIRVSDRRMANTVRKLQELPGQELFQYVDTSGNLHKVTSQDVNGYLKQITGENFSAKDFRTWGATVKALQCLSEQCDVTSQREAKRRVTAMLKSVSLDLGNTPAICRKSYVHPGIVAHYLDGSLAAAVKGLGQELEAECLALEILRRIA